MNHFKTKYIRIFFVFFFIITISFIPINPQSEKEKNLLLKLESSSGIGKIKIYQSLSQLFLYKSPEKVIKYAGEALALASKLGDHLEIARAQLNAGIGYLQSGRIDTANQHYESGLKIARTVKNNEIIGSCLNGIASVHLQKGRMEKALINFKEAVKYFQLKDSEIKLAGVYSNISLIYYKQGDYHQSIDFMLKSLNLYELLNNKPGIGIVLNSLGNVYKRLKNPEEALKQFTRGLEIGEEIGNLALTTSCLVNIGEIFRDKGDFSGSLDYYTRGLSVAKKLGSENYIAVIQSNIGDIKREQGKTDEALSAYRKSMEYFEKTGSKPLLLTSYLNIGELFLEEGKLDEAEKNLSIALKLSVETGEKVREKKALNSLALLYEKKGQLSKSLEYIKRSNLIQEKLFSADALKKISELQNIQQLAIAKKEQKIRELKIKRQELVTLFITTALILISLIALILYRRFRQKAKSNLELGLAYKRMEELAKHDPLTQLYNRRSMMERIEIEMIRMGRVWRPFCILMIDVDNFKEINDRYGHDCGDIVLKNLAMILKVSLRKQDSASRWGGEEFLLMLPETTLDGGSVIGEKIREKVEKTEVTCNDISLNFTITIGIDIYSKLGPANLSIRRADTAMYEGKKRGKNILIRSDDPTLIFSENPETDY